MYMLMEKGEIIYTRV